jgi:hypothetical protein
MLINPITNPNTASVTNARDNMFLILLLFVKFFSEEHTEMVSQKSTGTQNITVLVPFTCEIQQSLFLLF